MTTYQEKAEKYVREKLPELMELTAGCKLGRLIHKGKNKGKYHVGLITEDTGFLSVVHWSGNRVAKLEMVEAYKIIGHPIQLQHWLRVLETVDVRMVFVNQGTYFGAYDTDEDTELVKFNLTTGQPATPEDYQAFCEIVGII